MRDTPQECPVCGAYSVMQESRISALLAVCDVLVLKALETAGKWIVRHDRSRFSVLNGRPYHLAHTIDEWHEDVDDAIVDKALRGAWDVIPAMLDNHGYEEVESAAVEEVLNRYVHDLVITGQRHTIEELKYRFEKYLGLPVYIRDEPERRLYEYASAADSSG